MTRAAPITRAEVAAWVDEEAFARGEEYAQKGALLELQRCQDQLRARCTGSREAPYRLSARLAPGAILAADCSCPVGGAGRCKHVAALLLSFLAEPASFLETEDLRTSLSRKSAPELVELVLSLVEHDPELEEFIELRLDPRSGRLGRFARQQVAAYFRRHGGRFGAPARIADELDKIASQAAAHLRQSDAASAAELYAALSTEILLRDKGLHDEDGALRQVINACVEGLGASLARLDDPARRLSALQALFAVYRFDVDAGGLALGKEAPDLLLRHAQAGERRHVASWVREALAASKEWARAVYGGFLLDLEAEFLDDESFLRICQETGRSYDRVLRLLQLGRSAEAVETARRASDYDLLRLGELFLSHQRRPEAESLMQERLERSRDPRLFDFLLRSALARQDVPGAISLATRRFQARPDLSGYKALRDLARQTPSWDEDRARLLGHLRAQHPDLLRQIFLDEGHIEEALALLPPLRPGGYLENYPQLLTAEAAEATHPGPALRLYEQYAARLLEAQTRTAYREAASYLARARALRLRTGAPDSLPSLFQERARSDASLAEELRATGLLSPSRGE
jgi:uncharacterized Zn finger protein